MIDLLVIGRNNVGAANVGTKSKHWACPIFLNWIQSYLQNCHILIVLSCDIKRKQQHVQKWAKESRTHFLMLPPNLIPSGQAYKLLRSNRRAECGSPKDNWAEKHWGVSFRLRRLTRVKSSSPQSNWWSPALLHVKPHSACPGWGLSPDSTVKIARRRLSTKEKWWASLCHMPCYPCTNQAPRK